ncbi:fimbrial protein [Caballeronia sp. KNU42]
MGDGRLFPGKPHWANDFMILSYARALKRPRDLPVGTRWQVRGVRFFLAALLATLAALVASPAHAISIACEVNGTGIVPAAGVISVPVNAAPGTTVMTLAPAAFAGYCYFQKLPLTDTFGVRLAISTAPAAGFNDVYPTNVSGLGVRYTVGGGPGCDTVSATIQGTLNIKCTESSSGINVYFSVPMSVTVSFVTTGPIQSGASTLSSIPVVATTVFDPVGGTTWSKPALYTGVASGTLSTATCSVQTPGLAVTLPNVTTNAFGSGIGATAGRTGFNLSFMCAQGAKVSIVITDAVSPSNRTDVLTLGAESTAKGIGVQVLKDQRTTVLFGPDAAGPNVQNQWLIGASPDGLLTLPLSAQYVRTGAVTPGSVKALATFTMSYQ